MNSSKAKPRYWDILIAVVTLGSLLPWNTYDTYDRDTPVDLATSDMVIPWDSIWAITAGFFFFLVKVTLQ
jgi:hypothetical protein